MASKKRNPGALGATGAREVVTGGDSFHDTETDEAAKAKSARKPTPQKRWADAHPVERWAHGATRSAVRRGLIQRQPCEECGDLKTDAHHSDYHQPLAIRWLCRKHHKQAHRAAHATNEASK